MNCMMAGMTPVMIYLMMGRDMRPMQPSEPLFWVVMSLGIVAGFLIAYPVNVWLVSRGLKHGLMTVREPTEPRQAAQGHQEHSHGRTHPQDSSPQAMVMPKQEGSSPSTASDAGKGAGHNMTESPQGSGHQMHRDVTRPQLVAVTVFTPRVFLTDALPWRGPKPESSGMRG